MNDDEIRALVRVAIQKHLSAFARDESGELRRTPTEAAFGREGGWALSFGRYPLPRAEDDTMCLIEPAVRCNHCGYCQCHGH
ncbi:MAG: hypothetical protein A3J29_00985 [Acidobacteria bacterium RIFCSPLOWO2_12_FULL_67_14b]|nr:MAG: hypothetical protein A3J29_00985 [Acidobacteria bacterium RIFCSPLOWO2_12_FULL_67_14b]